MLSAQPLGFVSALGARAGEVEGSGATLYGVRTDWPWRGAMEQRILSLTAPSTHTLPVNSSHPDSQSGHRPRPIRRPLAPPPPVLPSTTNNMKVPGSLSHLTPSSSSLPGVASLPGRGRWDSSRLNASALWSFVNPRLVQHRWHDQICDVPLKFFIILIHGYEKSV